MFDLHDVPGGKDDWSWDNATAAAAEFAAAHPEFVLEYPPPDLSRGRDQDPVTYWPDGWLRRK